MDELVKDSIRDLAASSGLTDDDMLLILAKYMGYKKMPPTIDEFISNEYYLGKIVGPHLPNGIYPYWMDVLRKIFPNPIICRYPYISLGGAIGTGKDLPILCELLETPNVGQSAA